MFLLKKAGLVNNKVVLTTSEGTGINYVDGFINKLRHLDKKDLMENIIHEEKPLSDGVEENILEKLLAEEWLVEKKGFIPFISQKELQIDNSDVLKFIQATITNILANELEPNKEQIYLMALLYAIDRLKNFIKQENLGRQERTRMNELLEQEYVAKLIYNAVKNQPEPDSLKLIDIGPPGYVAGVTGLL